MKKILSYIFGILVVFIILGMAIKSCETKETCDVLTGDECQYVSDCSPLLIDLIF